MDKLSKAPLTQDIFGSYLPFSAPQGYDDEQTQVAAMRASIQHSKRLELYDRYAALPMTAKMRVLYISEMEIREAMISLQSEYQRLVNTLQDVIGNQAEVINALVASVASLEARLPEIPKAPETVQMSLELGDPEE